VDLETNYRCPAPVLERSVRLIEHNVERFAKTIRARPNATGSLVLAPSAADDVDRIGAVIRSWQTTGHGGAAHEPGTSAILARTNRELLPAAVAALRLGVPFQAPDLVLPIESRHLDVLLEEAARFEREGASGAPLLVRLGAIRAEASTARAAEPDGGGSVADDTPPTELSRAEVAAALLGWAAGFADLDSLMAAIAEVRAQLAELRRDDAALTLATAHGTKGLEFDHVAVIGLEAGRFPSARSIADAEDPIRAMEEERRLAYVAWTRARRSLTLVYDPGAPSEFLLEAFHATELGLPPAINAA
jgi:superfamily I DNA/RNA helicase